MTQGLEVNTSLTLGVGEPITQMFTGNAADGSVITLGTIECYMGITTYGSVTCNTLTATNIYTKTEVYTETVFYCLLYSRYDSSSSTKR